MLIKYLFVYTSRVDNICPLETTEMALQRIDRVVEAGGMAWERLPLPVGMKPRPAHMKHTREMWWINFIGDRYGGQLVLPFSFSS